MFGWLGRIFRPAGAGNRARLVVFPLLVVAVGPAIAAGAPAGAPAEGGSGSGVTVEDAHPGCHVRGTFEAPVSPSLAWQVLTDYDHISEFVHSMRTSRIERRGSDSLLVRQHATSGFFIFHRHVEVLLDVREDPPGLIRFRDVLGTDFHTYVGVWRIESDEGETRVTYELTADPNPAVPQAVYRGVLRGVARDLLSEVRAEMLRRAGGRLPSAD